ncbi:MAG: NAD-dependent protein deacylase [Clostridia bacterium]
MEDISKLIKIIDESKNLVFFGGAGVSTASGIPDFRSANGLYVQNRELAPETIISNSFFYSHTKDFYDFYVNKMIFPNAKPNIVHKKLAQWEMAGKNITVITQNIDNLHQLAGSKNVIELHGSVYRNNCIKCGKFFDVDYIINAKGVPICDKCGGLVKPDVILYGEPLNNEMWEQAFMAIAKADTMIVAGTSLVVYPAASLINHFNGKNLIVINNTPTQADKLATIVINKDLASVFEKF